MVDNMLEEKEVMLSDKALAIINGDLVAFVETIKDLVDQLEPQLKKVMHEIQPVTNVMKANLDKDETLLLVEKLTSNTGTLIEMLSFVEALDDLRKQMEPQLKAMMHEIQPVTNAVKSLVDNEKTWKLATKAFNAAQTIIEDEDTQLIIDRLSNMKTPVIQFMDCMCSKSEEVEGKTSLMETSLSSLVTLSEVLSTPMMQSMIGAIATAAQETKQSDIKPVSPLKMLSALRDKDVQRATGFLVHFLKMLGKGLNGKA